MVVETITYIPEKLVREISSLVILFKAVGGFVIGYIVFQVVRILLSRKNKKELQEIKRIVKGIDRKIDKLKK